MLTDDKKLKLIDLIEEYAQARALTVEAELNESDDFCKWHTKRNQKKQELYKFIDEQLSGDEKC